MLHVRWFNIIDKESGSMGRVIADSKTLYTFGTIILIGLLTAVSGELKVTPFDEMTLRFGFGSIVFFIALLMRPVPIIFTGIMTGLIVWLFRTLLDTMQLGVFQLTENLPAMVFYIVFAVGLSICRVYHWRSHPFILGLIGAGLELAANVIELILHIYLLNEILVRPEEYSILVLAAMIRSFFVVGVYSAFVVSEQKKRTEQLLNIHSNLYVEALYIEKIMQNIEEVTSKSYSLYRTLQSKNDAASSEALNIAQSIHEVKKDAQRINAGLAKIVQTEPKDVFDLNELLDLVAVANKQYALSKQKNIRIFTYYDQNIRVREHYLLLALMNNIVANAIEAIENEGTIAIHAKKGPIALHLSIQNSGPSIDTEMLEVIFDPGFTTKFSEHGYASTGIGLSHVKTIVEQLEGSIKVVSDGMTDFIITIPLKNL